MYAPVSLEGNEEDQPRHSMVDATSNFEDTDYNPWKPPANEPAPAGGHSQASGAVKLWDGYDAPV